MESFRKAYGALKDSTQVGLAKVNSDYKELDIAIVKATNHVEAPPKERHVRKILFATSASRPRADVAYCIYALAKRLSKTRSWIVAVKILIVIHRTLREGDPTFKEELVSYSRRRNLLQITNFRDDSSPLAWDCSAWLRTYALFLEERLECFKVLKFDIECERVTKTTKGEPNAECRPRAIQSEELLQQLPALQQLLYRLIGCQPEGSAFSNHVIQYAVALVLKESFKIYCSINDGIINLVDLFFDMPRHDAVKALNIYKKAGKQAESLADFYEYCKGLDLARNFQLPTLRQPPPSFLTTMEEYIKEAPQTGSVVHRLECYEHEASPRAAEPEEHVEGEKQEVEEEEKPQGGKEEPQAKEEEAELALVPTDGTADLLGLNEINPEAAKLEDTNALALAIIPSDGSRPSNSFALSNFDANSGWELALVTAPSNYTSQAVETKLAGGFDKLLLDSLYEDEAARKQLQLQNEGYGTGRMAAMNNPFEYQNDPFAASNSIAPPTNMQLALLGQQQQQLQHQQMMFQQQNMMSPQQQYLPYYPQYPQQNQMQYMSSSNPFGDPFFVGYPQNPPMSNQGNHLS